MHFSMRINYKFTNNMNIYSFIQYTLFIAMLFLITKPLGLYIARVFGRQKTFLDPVIKPVEKFIYQICRVDQNEDNSWAQYAVNILLFSLIGIVFIYFLLRMQAFLPLNPQHLSSVSSWLSLNTAVSFVGNTNWQAYSGETTISYFSQMAGLCVQNFLSAAVGICVAMVLIRAFSRQPNAKLGNFWVDLTRCVLWILLPICIVLCLVYIFEGVPQNFLHYIHATTLEGAKQIIPQGPVATQEVIKSLGTNGGGFFNANSAHPYENPTALTNFIQALSVFSIGAALTYTFGKMVGNTRQGWTILISMMILFIAGLSIMHYAEMRINPHWTNQIIDHKHAITSTAGNMEGKEVRFGVPGSVLYNNVITAASDGGVNSMLDSYTPTGGAVALMNMALGEIIIGGDGAGLYSMLMYVILTVFIAGLMVGRTPEFLGKKIEAAEMKMAVLAILVTPFCALLFTAIACMVPAAVASVSNHGPHGLTEILYAFTSSANNNGSAYSGLNANTSFYNVMTALAIALGRYLVIIPVIAIAGSVIKKKSIQVSAGTLSTTGMIFCGLLIGVIIIIAGLTYFPALSLGPIVEHLSMSTGKLF